VTGAVRRALPFVMLVGAAAGVVGAVAPWIPHRAAGLSVGGFALFESTKFFPAVRSGAVPLLREAFLLPLLISAVLLALAPALPDAPRRPAWWLGAAAAALIALLALPPYPAILTAHRDPEYKGQLLLATGTLLVGLLSPLARRLPGRAVFALEGALAAVGLWLPLLQFARVRPLYAGLYGAPVGIGWGLILYATGMALVLLGGACGLCLPRHISGA